MEKNGTLTNCYPVRTNNSFAGFGCLCASGNPHFAAPTQPDPTATPIPNLNPAPKNIVDIAVADGRFTTLVAAVQAAGLVETLTGEGPFTVFAPTDDAFAKLPAGTLEDLSKPENKETLKISCCTMSLPVKSRQLM